VSISGMGVQMADGLGGADVLLVPVDSLLIGDSPRLAGEDAEHTRRLAYGDADLPPILVNRADNRVVDGAHRVAAARLRGDREIRVRYFDGDPDDAFLAAVRANAEHGLPLTLADREAAAMRIIRSHPGLSDRAIAGAAKLSAHTVARLRARLSATDEVSDRGHRIGRDGRARPTDAARGRLAAASLILQNPGASLREIAVVAGISPATVRDVRLRMARGADPVPPALQSAACGQDRDRPAATPEITLRDVRPGPARAPDRRDLEGLLGALSRDPALRFNERGRALLRWLSSRAAGPSGWESVVDAIPPHSSYLFAELARGCAEEWLAFASGIEGRRDATGRELGQTG
jgi:DNA-binding CsgD family transcriptional regulator